MPFSVGFLRSWARNITFSRAHCFGFIKYEGLGMFGKLFRVMHNCHNFYMLLTHKVLDNAMVHRISCVKDRKHDIFSNPRFLFCKIERFGDVCQIVWDFAELLLYSPLSFETQGT